MPITNEIDAAADRLNIRFTGTVTDADLMTTFQRLYQDPRHRVGMRELTDCRPVERVEITGAGLQRLADATSAWLDPSGTGWKVAVVVPNDEVFGLGRMYELLREGSPENVRVFRDLVLAEQWLDEPTGR
jgi:hypothetical protein